MNKECDKISKKIGNIRKMNQGKALKLEISVEAFEQAERYTDVDAKEYVAIVIKLDDIYQLIEGKKESCKIIQIEIT